ncbi:hypothetical protein GCM10010503_59940 [Streptomyces lucensis JCM 4490]|uniref:Uncharacterized protein n=1 Tax=Streptomyces lucensis JCM 4490 TaxID=1306176 RepID=A0A918JCY6_9ACTN|nr:hypothetical protein GCM10010503_59940 [Streptomyces lucensis JCM 4490]
MAESIDEWRNMVNGHDRGAGARVNGRRTTVNATALTTGSIAAPRTRPWAGK